MATNPGAADPPRLLHFRMSHYNEKVRWALDYKKISYVGEALVPGFHIPRVRFLTGQNQVPVLVLDGVPIVGSSRILTEIERLFPDTPLFPSEATERERARSLEAFFDERVAPDLRRLFWSTYLDDPEASARMATDGFSSVARGVWRTCLPAMRPLFRKNMGIDSMRVQRARESLSGYFDRLESEVGRSGYLVGDRFGVADLAVASVMTAIVRPPEFPYPLPTPWPTPFADLRESVVHRSGFRWVLDLYARHRSLSCDSEALPSG